MTIQELCDLIGNDETFASLLGVSRRTIVSWKQAGFIPTKNWHDVVAAFHKRGFGIGVVTYKHLALMAANAMEKRDEK